MPDNYSRRRENDRGPPPSSPRGRSAAPRAPPRAASVLLLLVSVLVALIGAPTATCALSSVVIGGGRWRRLAPATAAARSLPLAVGLTMARRRSSPLRPTELLLSADADDDKFSASLREGAHPLPPPTLAAAFGAVVAGRYACTRFHRHGEPPLLPLSETEIKKKGGTGEGGDGTKKRASVSDPAVVRQALTCLDLARRSPSGFNAQPYRVVLVHGMEAKDQLARSCLGRNADRVRDSDATAVFLADREWGRDWGRFGTFLADGGGRRRRSSQSLIGGDKNGKRKRPLPGKWNSRYIRSLVLLFSSGYPIPRILAAPISFLIRLTVSLVGMVFNTRRLLVPTLSAAETWSTKNTSLVAMTYLLGCTSQGLATCPMEGHWAPGVRRALGVPRRYAVPIIVSTGLPYEYEKGKAEEEEEEADDVGMSHGSLGKGSADATPRYPLGEVVFGDSFGKAFELPP